MKNPNKSIQIIEPYTIKSANNVMEWTAWYVGIRGIPNNAHSVCFVAKTKNIFKGIYKYFF